MRVSTSAGETVTVFDIAQYFYCPRKVYYLRVLGVPAKPRRKMEVGREEQAREEERLTERRMIYGLNRRSVVEVLHRLYLENPEIGLAGQVDTVLRLTNGELIPVDCKYTDTVRVYRGFKKQLVAYCLLLDHAFHVGTNRGLLYFVQQREALEVPVTGEDKHFLRGDIESIRKILTHEAIPSMVTRQKCAYCEVERYCK